MYLISRLRTGALNIERGDWLQIAALGFAAVALNQYLYLYGMKFSMEPNCALVCAGTPLFVLVFLRMLLKENMTRIRTLGVVLAFVGIEIVIFERGIDFSSGYAYGNLLIHIAVIGWTLLTLRGMRVLLKYGLLRTTTAMMFCGALVISLLGIASILDFRFAEISALHRRGVLHLSLRT